uniref:Uncharacterized protein n=2 Tax=Anguilla anguilla TaxID=7936 RepID=A0A0E9T4L5_ANGAN
MNCMPVPTVKNQARSVTLIKSGKSSVLQSPQFLFNK